MTSTEECKICDFGISARFSQEKRDNVIWKGTHPFMAPEVWQWQLSRDCDFTKIDIFALGMMIWELLAAQLPWVRTHGGLAEDPSDLEMRSRSVC